MTQNDSRRTTMGALIERYEALLFDAYGVLVDQNGVLPEALELIDTLNRRGKPYWIVTNDASRLPQTRGRWFREHGLSIDDARVITSGALLPGYFARHRLAGARCIVIGPEDSRRYAEAGGGLVVEPSFDADFAFDVLVLCDEAGFDYLPTIDATLTALYRAIDSGRRPALVQPNPDLIYPKGPNAYGMAIGGISLFFEAALALRYPRAPELRFEKLGKPHPAIFEHAARLAGTRALVMIGDQLHTDIAGANRFGIDSALVGTGIARLDDLVLERELLPTYLLESLLVG